MLKIFKKFYKSILCFILIVSMVSPMYATSTSVDSEAFVSKEEFDKTLSDFRNRINTFKTGINSKIDMQISSYLDRNGIWNGRSEDILPFTCECGFSVNTGINMTCYKWGFRTDTNAVKPILEYKIDTDKCIVSKISKNGLACLHVVIKSVCNMKSNRILVACNNSDPYLLNHDDFITQVFTVYTRDEGNKWVWLDTHRLNTAMTFKEEGNIDTYAYFFVSAKDALYVTSKIELGDDSWGAWDNNDGDYWYKSFVVDEIKIY